MKAVFLLLAFLLVSCDMAYVAEEEKTFVESKESEIVKDSVAGEENSFVETKEGENGKDSVAEEEKTFVETKEDEIVKEESIAEDDVVVKKDPVSKEEIFVEPFYRDTELLVEDKSKWWFYNELSETEKYIYDEYLKIASNVCEGDAEELKLDRKITSQDFFIAYTAIRQDHPELFWLATNRSISERDGNYYLQSPSAGWAKKWTEEEFKAKKDEFNREADKFLEGFNKEWSVDMQLWWILERLDHKVKYVKGNPNSHSTDGAIVSKGAVCEGIAMAYKHLIEKAQVPVEAVVQLVGIGSPLGGTSEHHAWNAVKIEGSWYFTDPTWVVSSSDSPDYYNYLNVQYKDFKDTHHSLQHTSKYFEKELENSNSSAHVYESFEYDLGEEPGFVFPRN